MKRDFRPSVPVRASYIDVTDLMTELASRAVFVYGYVDTHVRVHVMS